MTNVKGVYYIIGLAGFANQSSCVEQHQSDSVTAAFTRVKKFLEFVCSTASKLCSGKDQPPLAGASSSARQEGGQLTIFLAIKLFLLFSMT
jgi:hypothetical protein